MTRHFNVNPLQVAYFYNEKLLEFLISYYKVQFSKKFTTGFTLSCYLTCLLEYSTPALPPKEEDLLSFLNEILKDHYYIKLIFTCFSHTLKCNAIY